MSEKETDRLTIKSWAEEDRPREKFILKGKQTLSDAELIAILISSGNAEETAVELSQRILKSVDNNLQQLTRMNVKELMELARRRPQDFSYATSNSTSRSFTAAISLFIPRKTGASP